MEFVRWLDWKDLRLNPIPLAAERLYLGDECCAGRLPDPAEAARLLRKVSVEQLSVTLVTPFVSEQEGKHVLRLVDQMSRMCKDFEVVCNDWGIFQEVSQRENCMPIIGRLLVKQDTDPRLGQIGNAAYQSSMERTILHADGNLVHLKYASPHPDTLQHMKSCALDNIALLNYLGTVYRVNRFEVNNTLQGLVIDPPDNWHISLHIPEVLVSVSRYCAARKGNYFTDL
ncbi:MAG: hypothetical protein ACM3NJ_00255, partial [Methanobacterium sp.]